VFGTFYRKKIYTGEDYLQAVRDGYMPVAMGTMDRIRAMPYVTRTLIPALLRLAEPSVTSHVAGLRLDRLTPADLPKALDTFVEDDPEPETTMADGCHEVQMGGASPVLMEWLCVDMSYPDYPSRWFYSLTILGWGDWNGDGIEDVLGSFYQSHYTGTHRDQYPVILTRMAADARLELVALGDWWLLERLREGMEK
jgi:hypothetical protein